MKTKALLLILYIFATKITFCEGPLYVDDAGVVGNKLIQWENWMHLDKLSIHQWHLIAYGINNNLELTIGGAIGLSGEKANLNDLSYTLPVIQGKLLLFEKQVNGWLGITNVLGTVLPIGKGLLLSDVYSIYDYFAITKSFGEDEIITLHFNLGSNIKFLPNNIELIPFWGLNSYIKILDGYFILLEVFSDYHPDDFDNTAFQSGVKVIFSEQFNLFITVGQGITGQNKLPFWGRIGLKLVFPAIIE